MNRYKLNDLWTLWLHLPHDSDWSINSYKKVSTLTFLEECVILIENMSSQIEEKCMLFLMKNNIKPIWEDEKNKKGGCLSYKIAIENVSRVWKRLVYALVGNHFLLDNGYNSNSDKDILKTITGLSISPKKNFSIIKLWIGNMDILSSERFKNISMDLVKQNLSYYPPHQSERAGSIQDYVKPETVEIEIVDPFDINKLCGIERHNCIFKKHSVLY
jgi:hypothetical protein